MPIDPSIPLGVRPPEVMSPAQMIQLRNLQRAGQIQELQLAEQTRQVQNRNRMLEITGTPGNIDPQTNLPTPGAIQQMYGVDPAAGQRAAQERNVALAQLSVQSLRQREALEKKIATTKDIARQATSAYDLALERTGGNQEEATRAAVKARNDAIEELRKSGYASTIGITDAEISAEIAKPFDVERMRAMVTTPAEMRTRTEPKSSLGRLEADFKAGRISKADYEAAKKKATTIPSLSGEGVPSSDALTLAAEQYLAGDSTAGQGYARNAQAKKAFVEKLTEIAKEKGMTGADVAAKVAEFQGVKAGQRSLGTRQAQVDMAVTEAENMMPLALTASDKVDRTKYPTLNSLIIAYEKGTGDENVVRLGIATNSLINIYARAVNPTGTPTVSDKEHARELLSSAWSKGQFAAGIDQLKKEMQAAKASPGQVRKDLSRAVSGREDEPKSGALTPEEQQELESLRKRFGR